MGAVPFFQILGCDVARVSPHSQTYSDNEILRLALLIHNFYWFDKYSRPILFGSFGLDNADSEVPNRCCSACGDVHGECVLWVCKLHTCVVPF